MRVCIRKSLTGFQGHFVRVSYNEVSVSHPDAIKKILLAPLPKVSNTLETDLQWTQRLIHAGAVVRGDAIPRLALGKPHVRIGPKKEE